MNFWERMDSLMTLEVNRKSITLDLRLAPNSFSIWAKRKTFPAVDIVLKIAEKLGTSVEYLVIGEDPSGLPPRILALARDIATLAADDIASIEALVAVKVASRRAAQANA